MCVQMGVCGVLIKAPITESVPHKARLYPRYGKWEDLISTVLAVICFSFRAHHFHGSLHSVSVCNGLKNFVISRRHTPLTICRGRAVPQYSCRVIRMGRIMHVNKKTQETGLRTVKPMEILTLLLLFILDYFSLGWRLFAHVAGAV